MYESYVRHKEYPTYYETLLTSSKYKALVYQTGFDIVAHEQFTTGKKLTAEQTQEEIRFACDRVPKTYGIEARCYDDVWKKFGKAIEEHGCGHLSKTVLFITKKT